MNLSYRETMPLPHKYPDVNICICDLINEAMNHFVLSMIQVKGMIVLLDFRLLIGSLKYLWLIKVHMGQHLVGNGSSQRSSQG